MIHRPLQRRSRLAGWSRALGTFALPVLIVAIVGHRSGRMATDHAVVLAVAAFAIAAMAVAAGLVAAVTIWNDGRLGARHAVYGLLYGVLGLMPLGWVGTQAALHPRLLDVSTDAVDPPLFHAAAMLRVGRFNSPTPPTPAERARIRAATPEIGPRRYSVGSDLLYAVTLRRIEAAGWTILEREPPSGDGDRGRIEAVARSLVFGLPDDVVVRILPEPSGARIDLRNSPRWGDIDFGRGAARIRAFLDDLDTAVAETYGS